MSNSIYRFSIMLIWVFTGALHGNAQEGIGYHFYPELPHQNILNPEVDTSVSWTISGSLYNHLISNSITIGEISTLEGNVRTFDFDLGKEKTKSRNIHEFSKETNYLNLQYGLGELLLRGGYNQKSYVQIAYSKELFDLLADGNASFIGQAINLNPNAEVSTIHEFYLGFSKDFSGLRVGANLKFLSGSENLHTQNDEMVLTTADEIYQLAFQNNYELQTAGVLSYNSYDDVVLNYSSGGFSNMFNTNYGFGLDLSLDYYFSDGHRLFASIQDLGSVKWDFQATSYKSVGTFEYAGLDILEYLNTEDDVALQDSLESLLQVEETDMDYSVSTPTTIIAGFQYVLDTKTDVGVLVNARTIANEQEFTLAANVRRRVHKNIQLGVSYNNRLSTYDNLGLSALIDYRNIQLLFVTDNILALIDPIEKRNFSLMLAAAISF